ncbi:MAG: sterol carrier protein domain-containing protein [Pseudonocardiaceae bacterium]
MPLDVTTDTDDTTERFTLRITAGKGELAPSVCEGRLRVTRRQFAVWYAGGYRTVTAATLAGVRGDPQICAFARIAWRTVGAICEQTNLPIAFTCHVRLRVARRCRSPAPASPARRRGR